MSAAWHGPVLPDDLAVQNLPCLSRRTDHPTAATSRRIASVISAQQPWLLVQAAHRAWDLRLYTAKLTKIEQCYAEESLPVTLKVVEHARSR